jgi:tetratricopeptide (TPR) repeat protein
LGCAYLKLGKFDEAINCLAKSLEIALNIGDKLGEINLYRSLGNACKLLDKHHEAIEYYKKSLNIAIEIGKKEAEGHTNASLGGVFLLIDKFDEAFEYCEKSLNIAKELGDKTIEALAYRNLGLVYRTLSTVHYKNYDKERCENTKEQSIYSLKEAVRCWEWLFIHLIDRDDFKISIVDTFINTYKLLTIALIENKQIEEALLVCDRGRARALGDLLVSKYGITKENASRSIQMEYVDVETVLLQNKFCIIQFSFDAELVVWVLAHQKQLLLFKCGNQLLTSITETLLQSENGEEIDMELIFLKCVNKAYDTMKVSQPVTCENRSLELLENVEVDDPDAEMEASSVSSVENNITPVEETPSDSQQDACRSTRDTV